MTAAAALEGRDDLPDLTQGELLLAGAPQAVGEAQADLRQIRIEVERRAEGVCGAVGAPRELVDEARQDVRRGVGRIAGERALRFARGVVQTIRLEKSDRCQNALGGRRRAVPDGPRGPVLAGCSPAGGCRPGVTSLTPNWYRVRIL